MKARRHDVHWMAATALMAAVVALLGSTPLGMIPLPFIKATTTHIPVIVGAILLGPLAGTILGVVFGICSMISNTVTPAVLSFAFCAFLAMSEARALTAVWISVGCRAMIGLSSGWLWIFLKRLRLGDNAALPIVGFVGSMTNTVFVMGSIYFLLRPEFAQAKNVALDAVLGLVMTTVTTSGVLEAIVGLVLVTALGKVLLILRPVLIKPSKSPRREAE